MRLLIVSHTAHYETDGGYVGWSPTVRELDYLAQLFDQVVHVATLHPGPPPASAQKYSVPNIELRPVAPTGGHTLLAKAGIIAAYPAYARVIRDEMNRADVIHIRCPANVSLLALFLLGRAGEPRYRWVKYAGNWQPDAGDSWSYALQRRWLRSNRLGGMVTINGRWPAQPAHVLTFDNPSLTDEELAAGATAATNKRLTLPVELLFVGALNDAKGAGRALEIALALQRQGVDFQLRYVGDGPDRPRYQAWAEEHDLRNVYFEGWKPRAEVSPYLARAHFILLPSRSEGWPKVLSEGMAYGAVPIAARTSSIPQILAETGAGVAVPTEDIDGATSAIVGYLNNRAGWETASRAGVASARRFTYRTYQAAVVNLFAEAWGVRLPDPSLMEPPGSDPNGHIRPEKIIPVGAK